jgi:hypothetical protein
MAILKSKTVNHRTGDYWKILSASFYAEYNETYVEIHLFDSKEFRENINGKLRDFSIHKEIITFAGGDFTMADLYSKIKESKMSERIEAIEEVEATEDTPEIIGVEAVEPVELNWFADTEDSI